MSGMTFFKATRSARTDFHTGRVRYEVGRRVRPLPLGEGESRRLCGPGLLHAATVETEVLVGGRWPCRLFEVTGRPVAGLDDEHPHKAGFRQLMVLRELEAWRVFGPAGREVVALIDRAGRLTDDEARALNAAQALAWAAARAAAWYVAHAAEYAAARHAARRAAWDGARHAAWAAAWAAAWDAAGPAPRHAAGALVVRDLITSDQFDALYGPWASVIG